MYRNVAIASIAALALVFGGDHVAAQKPQALKDAETAAREAQHEADLARGFGGGTQKQANEAPKTQADLDAEKAMQQAEKDEQAARDAQDKADESQANVDANVPGSAEQARKDQQAADEAAKKAQESENAAEAAKSTADKGEKPNNPQRVNREKQKKKRETAQKAWEKRRKLERLKKQLGLSLAPRPSEGPTLAALASAGKIKIDSTGTGETIGHVADLKIENLTDQPVNCSVGPMVLESKSRKNQDYVVPKGETVKIEPHGTTTVPMDGVCINRNKPPVGKGVPGDLVVNTGDPTIPQNPNSHTPAKQARDLLRITTAKYEAAEKLQKDGALKDLPYRDPQQQIKIAEQWSTWSDPRISEITGAPPATKDDLKKVVYKQLEEKGPMSPTTKKKVDQGIDTIFEKVELTTAKAKDLEKPDAFTEVELTGEQAKGAPVGMPTPTTQGGSPTAAGTPSTTGGTEEKKPEKPPEPSSAGASPPQTEEKPKEEGVGNPDSSITPATMSSGAGWTQERPYRVTQTVKDDGTRVETETTLDKNGNKIITTTTRDKDGVVTTKTRTMPDGSKVTTTFGKDGVVTTTSTDKNGNTVETTDDGKGRRTGKTSKGSYTVDLQPDGSRLVHWSLPNGAGGSTTYPLGTVISPNTSDDIDPLPYKTTR